jgi:hypothetical protein
MKRRMRLFILILVLFGGLFLFHQLGRSIWHPLALSVRDERTIASVVAETTSRGLGFSPEEKERIQSLTLIGLKEERRVEVWGHDDEDRREILRTFPFQGYSGTLGPKLREGDGQIPEGLYRVEYLNPNSSYHLSLKIDYPNSFDREMGRADGRDRLGYDIFFHGKSVTVGCIPIGDEAIEELFTLVAQISPAKVTVIVSPWDFRLRDDEPEVDGVSWEGEIYETIRSALQPFAPAEESGRP